MKAVSGLFRSLLLALPLLLVIALGYFLYQGLKLQPDVLDSALEGQPLPDFHLENLMRPQHYIQREDLLGEILILNVWATWCPACRYEHSFLMQLAREKQWPLIGLNYRDPDREQVLAALSTQGNPFDKIIIDREGTMGIDLGVYGAPETFLIDQNGIIRLRHAGILNQAVWATKFLPLIRQLQEQ